jgi:hypothetical protein
MAERIKRTIPTALFDAVRDSYRSSPGGGSLKKSAALAIVFEVVKVQGYGEGGEETRHRMRACSTPKAEERRGFPS